jgi:membrane-associated phospholipid phosphatase
LRIFKPKSIQQLFRDNIGFFVGYLIFLIAATVFLLIINTGDAVLFFSEHRTRLLNLLFVYGTRAGEEIMYFIVIFILLFFRYRYAITVVLLGLSVTVVTFSMKALFGHDRPALFFRKLGQLDEILAVEGVRLNQGANSFPSGHTMSAFALFGFLAFCIPKKHAGGTIFFLIALMVGLSRIYLMQHFLKDVYLGSIIGVMLAIAWYYLAHVSKSNWLDGSLLRRRNPVEAIAEAEVEG